MTDENLITKDQGDLCYSLMRRNGTLLIQWFSISQATNKNTAGALAPTLKEFPSETTEEKARAYFTNLMTALLKQSLIEV